MQIFSVARAARTAVRLFGPEGPPVRAGQHNTAGGSAAGSADARIRAREGEIEVPVSQIKTCASAIPAMHWFAARRDSPGHLLLVMVMVVVVWWCGQV